MLARVCPAADPGVDHLLAQMRRSLAEPGHAVDHVDDQMEAVEIVQHHHGSEFDANTGAVLRGPAATPLARKRVIERRGSIYAV